MKKSVLMISYGFPPIGGSGVQRTTKFVKYLPAVGYEPVVLTVNDKTNFVRDESLMKDVPEDTVIYRSFPWDALYLLPWMNKFKLGLFIKFIDRKILIPDGKLLWQFFTRGLTEKIIKKHGIKMIYSTSAPYSNHMLAMWLKKKHPELKWVADFRDEWTNNPYVLDHPHSKVRTKIEKTIEHNILKQADHIIANTPLMMKSFMDHNPDIPAEKYTCISNGYDEADFAGIVPSKVKRDKFQITYTGTFYGRRTPKYFFEALSKLIQEGKLDKKKIAVEVIGDNTKEKLVELIAQFDLGEIVQITDYLEHKESIKRLLSSDLLLFIIGAGAGAETFYTGKIFEYLYAQTPILACVPEKGVAADLIREARAGKIADSRDVDQIAKNLLYYYEDWKQDQGKFDPDLEVIKRYERKELTKRLTELFDQLLS